MTTRSLRDVEVVDVLRGAVRDGSEVPVTAPRDEAELVDLVHRARRDRLRLLPIGGGTRVAWTNPTDRADLAVSTRAMTGIVYHEPDDGTITARAGTTMASLTERARAGGHHLSPDVDLAATSTLGGVVGAGWSGVDRLRCGPLRNQLLGTRVVLADGSASKSGGRLVKNVTGFDLHRLYCGSNGALGVVVEASLRLAVAPEVVRHLVLPLDRARDAWELASALRAAVAAPWTFAIDVDPDGSAHAHLELAGRAPVVQAEFDALPRAWRSAEVAEGGDAARAHEHYREGEPDPRLGAVVRVDARPSRVAAAFDLVTRAFTGSTRPRFVRVQPHVARIDVRLGDAPAGDVARAVRELRAAAAPVRAAVRVGGPLALRREVDCFDALGPERRWMRALRDRFDPDGVFAAGRGPDLGPHVGAFTSAGGR